MSTRGFISSGEYEETGDFHESSHTGKALHFDGTGVQQMRVKEAVGFDSLIRHMSNDRLLYSVLEKLELLAEQQEHIEERLNHMTRALALPAVYNHEEACRRLGISKATGYRFPDRLPMPLSRRPLRYSVEAVENLARGDV